MSVKTPKGPFTADLGKGAPAKDPRDKTARKQATARFLGDHAKALDKKEAAADAMGLTAERLQKLELVDEVLKEPLGGAHRDAEATAALLKAAVLRHLDELGALTPEELIAARERRLAGFGVYTDSKA